MLRAETKVVHLVTGSAGDMSAEQPSFLERSKATPSKSGKGPPNRLNDLSYSEWMKFQKSFFWFDSANELIGDSIEFFTKEAWPDRGSSRSLVVNKEELDFELNDKRRIRQIVYSDPEAIYEKLESEAKSRRERFDFIFVNLLEVDRPPEVTRAVQEDRHRIFGTLREILREDMYACCLLENRDGEDEFYPEPWSIGLACRDYLRLRDEKVGLDSDGDRTVYLLVMQASDDERSVEIVSPGECNVKRPDFEVPKWLLPKSPPRKKHEKKHPAKYPESLVRELIKTFTEEGDSVLDPMVGTGSAVIAALQTHRSGFGVDLLPEYVEIAKQRIEEYTGPSLFDELYPSTEYFVTQGDARSLGKLSEVGGRSFDYIITSPPYWSMLQNPGSENQRKRREEGLPLTYSSRDQDLGNIDDYDEFLSELVSIYDDLADYLKPDCYLTVVVKNVKRDHVVYPIAWDLTYRLARSGGKYIYAGNTLWCQDDVGLKPFGVGIVWVSNTLHNYCLHFKRR